MVRMFADRYRYLMPGLIRRDATLTGVVLAVLLLMPMLAQALDAETPVGSGSVEIGHKIVLNYIEHGSGPPVIFVHGSLSDFSYWQDQVVAFSKSYRAIAYSRRYNVPNKNPAVPGYSAVTDADDLAAFIAAMHLDKAYIIGHSYGALAGLFLATRHPELIRALVIAEPPAVSLLQHLSSKNAQQGQAMYADIYRRMVKPMRAKFARGDSAGGVAAFIDYVFDDPHAWERMSPEERADSMRNAHEWEVMMTQGTLFPEIDPLAVQSIKLPVLIISGGKTMPFLALIDRELAQWIPHSRNIVFEDSGHQMWLQHPVECRDQAEAFFRAQMDPPH